MAASKSGVIVNFGWNGTPGALVYDVLRGKVRRWPVGSSPATETCFADEVIGTAASDATVPVANDGYWYLVRAENGCGNGSWGSQAVHGVPTVPRLSSTCP